MTAHHPAPRPVRQPRVSRRAERPRPCRCLHRRTALGDAHGSRSAPPASRSPARRRPTRGFFHTVFPRRLRIARSPSRSTINDQRVKRRTPSASAGTQPVRPFGRPGCAGGSTAGPRHLRARAGADRPLVAVLRPQAQMPIKRAPARRRRIGEAPGLEQSACRSVRRKAAARRSAPAPGQRGQHAFRQHEDEHLSYCAATDVGRRGHRDQKSRHIFRDRSIRSRHQQATVIVALWGSASLPKGPMHRAPRTFSDAKTSTRCATSERVRHRPL